jgi:hypothetical protein
MPHGFVIAVALAATLPADDVKQLAERLGKIGALLKSPHTIASDSDRHQENLKALRDYRAFVDEVQTKWSAQLRKAEFSELYRNWHYANAELQEYERYAGMFASADAIKERLGAVRGSAKLGVENDAPGFFAPGNDVQNGLATARRMHAAFAALDPKNPAVAAAQAEIDAATREVEKMSAGMRDRIIAAHEPPPDLYRGADREALLEIVRAKWAKAGVAGDVLKVGLVAPQWARKAWLEKLGSAWHWSEVSRLQGYVVVKRADGLAARHSVNLSKDHQSNDEVSASFLNDPKAEPPLDCLMPLAKAK